MQSAAEELGECANDVNAGGERKESEVNTKPKVASKLRPQIRICALGKGMQAGGSSVTHEVTKFSLPYNERSANVRGGG